MFIKTDLLPIAFCCISICLFDNYYCRIILAIIWMIIFFRLFTRKHRIVAWGIITGLIILSYPITNRFVYTAKITQIKDTYYLAKSNLSSIMIYCDSELKIGDELLINGEIEQLSYYDNFNKTTFYSWAKGNNVIGSIKLKNPMVVNHHFSIASLIYQSNRKRGLNWCNELLFGSGLSNDSSYSYLFSSAGFHISFLALTIKQLLSFFVYPEQASKYTLVVMIILALVFGFQYNYLKVIISIISTILIKDKRNCLALQIILLCYLRPYYVSSISFVVPVGLKIISLFSSRYSPVVNRIFLLDCQLYYNESFSLVSLISFSFYSYVSGGLFIIALLLTVIPLKINMEGLIAFLINIMEKSGFIKLTLSIDTIVFLIICLLLLGYLSIKKKSLLFFIIIVLLFNNNKALFIPCYTITQLDVGQGDCAVVRFPFSNKGLLIDVAGNIYKDISKEIIVPYLNREGIKSVDVIITHQDYDHSGGLDSLAKQFKVNNIYYDKQQLIMVNRLQIFNPMYDCQYDNENDNSLISYFKIGQFYFLYLADVSYKVEMDLVNRYPNLQADIVKLSHHGSNTASSDRLLSSLRFKIAIISAGRSNYYNHPSSEVVERLNNYQKIILSTKSQHAIKFYVFNHICIYITADHHIGVFYK